MIHMNGLERIFKDSYLGTRPSSSQGNGRWFTCGSAGFYKLEYKMTCMTYNLLVLALN